MYNKPFHICTFPCKPLSVSSLKTANLTNNVFLLVALCPVCSQYTSLWSVGNSPLTSVSQAGSMASSLGSQFLRGSASHYSSLAHPVTAPSSGSQVYDSTAVTEVHEASQYDSSAHVRLPTAWTQVTPSSL